jgi:crossover junction endodeoxyribonuclease RusA
MVEFTFYPPYEPWSLNQERTKHWSWRAKRTRAYRFAAMAGARNLRIEPQPPSRVLVQLAFAKASSRRDPSNYLPAVKAIVDGLVDAGLWPDDTAEFVSVEEPVLAVSDLVLVRVLPRD